MRGLTAELASARARSGMPGSSRIAGEGPRRPESNLAMATAHGALRLAWLGEEVAGDEAELLGTTGRRGRGGGYGDARRRRRWFSGEREREQGEKRRARESESGAGQLRGFVRGIEGVRGSRRWPAGGEVARARAGERRAHALVLLSEEGDDRRQRGWAGPPAGDGPGKWPR